MRENNSKKESVAVDKLQESMYMPLCTQHIKSLTCEFKEIVGYDSGFIGFTLLVLCVVPGCL